MKAALLTVALVVLAIAAAVQAKEPPANQIAVEYLSGHAGEPHQLYGWLAVGDQALSFVSDQYGFRRRRHTFVVPIDTVTKASTESENHGNAGAVLAFGLLGLAARTHDEYVFVTTETAAGADVLVFRILKERMAAAAVAKIEFAVKHAHDPAPPLP
jgi:hypothetical protein